MLRYTRLCLALAAITLADETDFLNMRADARFALAEVLVLGERGRDAAALVEEARALYIAKGNSSAARLLDGLPTLAETSAGN